MSADKAVTQECAPICREPSTKPRGINPHVLAELLGDNNGKSGAEDILRSALHSMSTELMVIYHLFWSTKIFDGEDFPGDEVTEMIFRLSKRAEELSELGIDDEVNHGT